MGGEDHYFLIARDAGYSKIFGIGLENSPAGACTEAMSCYSGLNYTSSTPNTTGDVYFAIWYDGTYLRWGFTDSGSKPTKWSDFTSTDRGSWTGSCGYTSGDFTIIKFGARENTSAPLAPSYYYFVCSKSVLIDNDS